MPASSPSSSAASRPSRRRRDEHAPPPPAAPDRPPRRGGARRARRRGVASRPARRSSPPTRSTTARRRSPRSRAARRTSSRHAHARGRRPHRPRDRPRRAARRAGKVIPYAALLYEKDGSAFVYTNPQRPDVRARAHRGRPRRRRPRAAARGPGRRHAGRDHRRAAGPRRRAGVRGVLMAAAGTRGPDLMRWIVSRSLRYRWLVIFVATGLMVFGAVSIPGAKVDVFPEFAPPQVEIQTIALGNSSAEVEELVTVPIEEVAAGHPGPEGAALEVRLAAVLDPAHLREGHRRDEGAPARAGARRAGRRRSIPTWASPPWMMPAASATSRIMKIGLSSEELDLTELSAISYWTIRQRLMRVPGVALGRHLRRAPQAAPHPGRPGQARPLRHLDRPGHGGRLGGARRRRAAVRQELHRRPGRLRRVRRPAAEHRERPADQRRRRTSRRCRSPSAAAACCAWPTSAASCRTTSRSGARASSTAGPGLLLIVQKYRGANTVEVTKGVDTRADAAAGRAARRGASTRRSSGPATFIEQSIDNLSTALLIGVLLVIADHHGLPLRAAHGVHQPDRDPALAARGGARARRARHDDQRHGPRGAGGRDRGGGRRRDHRRREHRQTPATGARGGQRRRRRSGSCSTPRSRCARAITYATIINVVAIVPVLFLTGLSGSFFQPLVLSYALAVLVSMARRADRHAGAVPAHALARDAHEGGAAAARPQARLRRGARGHPAPAQPGDRLRARRDDRRAWRSTRSLGSQLLPNFKERDFLMHWLTEPSTSVKEEYRISVAACQDLQKIPGVRNCGSHIGQALLVRRGLRRVLRRELDLDRQGRRLRQDAGGRRARRSTATRACSATSRPTCASASRRS